MAATKRNQQPNLASLLAIKRKMNDKSNARTGERSTPPPTIATGSHSNDKLTYRQDATLINPPITTAPPATTSDPPKISRKTKQLEVEQLNKKMEEINRKQEAQTNVAKDSWKGFDDLNYGFTPGAGTQNPTPVPPAPTNQVNYAFI
jgi:hypothetical protein